METCDVLVVGGGPAGSHCAGMLMQGGLDVLLVDAQTFPRQKPCAGWITPAVFAALGVDAQEYRQGRVLQEISGFRTGLIGGEPHVTRYDSTVSYGIRRCEFDHFLLQRSNVRQSPGEKVATLERKGDWWLVNSRIKARMLVGAGGHFCPVARLLGAKVGREDVVAAQVTEFALTAEAERRCTIPADTPALFFCRDMKGYGWLFRKGGYLNIGLGRLDSRTISRHTGGFCAFLTQKGYLAETIAGGFQGHAYRLFQARSGRRCTADGALLIGDAAGVAQPLSGEGILPAIESARLAAGTILAAKGDYRCSNLESYPHGLAQHFGAHSIKAASLPVVSGVARFLGARLLSSERFTRTVVLDRWFLHTAA